MSDRTASRPIPTGWSGALAGAVVAAEVELRVTFPRSYRAWLRACNDTWIAGGEIFGLAPAEFAGAADTDIRYRRRLGDPWRSACASTRPPDDERWEFHLTWPTARCGVLVAHDRRPEEYAESCAGSVARRLAEIRPWIPGKHTTSPAAGSGASTGVSG